MDKQYRMAEWFSSELDEDDLSYFCEDEIKVVVHAVNTHDAMQDKIAELQKQLYGYKAGAQAKAIEEFGAHYKQDSLKHMYTGFSINQHAEAQAKLLRQQATDISTQLVDEQEK